MELNELFEDKLIIDALVAENKTKSGIYMPEEDMSPYVTAKVLKTGSKVERVKVGDTILYRKDTPIDLGNYGVMLSEFNVIGTVK